MYTVRELTKTPDDFRKIVRQIAEIGYAAIEGSAPKDMTPAEFKRFVDDLGIGISSVWAMPKPENVQKLVDTAGVYGIKQLVGCVGPDRFQSADSAKQVGDEFQAAAELLKPHGIELCYHNHWWELVPLEGRYGWDILFERAPALKAQVDAYWASNFGVVDVPALIERYKAITPLMHVKDGPLVKDQPNTAVGKGKMDIPACVHAADAGVLRYIIVELDAYTKGHDHMMEAVRDSFVYLRDAGLGTGR
jgi:sugar phosphate isomerase/epimerase